MGVSVAGSLTASFARATARPVSVSFVETDHGRYAMACQPDARSDIAHVSTLLPFRSMGHAAMSAATRHQGAVPARRPFRDRRVGTTKVPLTEASARSQPPLRSAAEVPAHRGDRGGSPMSRRPTVLAAMMAAVALIIAPASAFAAVGAGGNPVGDGVWSTSYSGVLPYAMTMRLGHVSDGSTETATIASNTAFNFGFSPLDAAISALGMSGDYFQEARWSGGDTSGDRNMAISCASSSCAPIAGNASSSLLAEGLPVTLALAPINPKMPAVATLRVGVTNASLQATEATWMVGTLLDQIDVAKAGVGPKLGKLATQFVASNLSYVVNYINAAAGTDAKARTAARNALTTQLWTFLTNQGGAWLVDKSELIPSAVQWLTGTKVAASAITFGIDVVQLGVKLYGMGARSSMGLNDAPVSLAYTPTVYQQGIETPAKCVSPVGAYCGVESLADAYGPTGFTPSTSYMSDGPATTTDTAYPVQVEYGMGAAGISVYHPFGAPQTQKSDISSPCWLYRCNETVELDSAPLNLPNNLMTPGRTIAVRLDGNYDFGNAAGTSIAGTTDTGTVSVSLSCPDGGLLGGGLVTAGYPSSSNFSPSTYNQLTPIPFSLSSRRGTFQASQITGSILRGPKACAWRVVVKVYAWINGQGFAYARMSVSNLSATIIVR